MARVPRTLEPRSLIVSCQAHDDNPLRGSLFMRRMALAALQGGAHAIRADAPEDVRAIRAVCDAPLIGLYKDKAVSETLYITPTLEHAREIVRAGADIVALDASTHDRPAESLEVMIEGIHALRALVFADCATLEDAVTAARFGADFVSTTMAGYTPATTHLKGDGPDFALLEAMVREANAPVIGEGRYWTPEDVRRGFALGAHGIVVGTAITNPREITRRFTRAVKP
jgi:putative N-acetylmannosamine-6-phosphate epimerase